jgi:DNA-directed RNA polymerase specialized sigma24 family protein
LALSQRRTQVALSQTGCHTRLARCEKQVMVAMTTHDDDLLTQFVDGDPDAFVAFYRRHLAAVLGYFLRRTGNPELTADLTAEMFAAALLGAESYRPGERPALAWLYGIAAHKLADSRRRGRVEDEARRRLAMEPLAIDDADLGRVAEMARRARATATGVSRSC